MIDKDTIKKALLAVTVSLLSVAMFVGVMLFALHTWAVS
ncbi:hypothetical protein HTVC168P_gp4 [Pelagibacter phage HTVC168P]|nr:hypothetical protein HTVC168P_gp4 [Pelagibacter phage HTVC168P]